MKCTNWPGWEKNGFWLWKKARKGCHAKYIKKAWVRRLLCCVRQPEDKLGQQTSHTLVLNTGTFVSMKQLRRTGCNLSSWQYCQRKWHWIPLHESNKTTIIPYFTSKSAGVLIKLFFFLISTFSKRKKENNSYYSCSKFETKQTFFFNNQHSWT